MIPSILLAAALASFVLANPITQSDTRLAQGDLNESKYPSLPLPIHRNPLPVWLSGGSSSIRMVDANPWKRENDVGPTPTQHMPCRVMFRTLCAKVSVVAPLTTSPAPAAMRVKTRWATGFHALPETAGQWQGVYAL